MFPTLSMPTFEVDLPSNPNIKYRFRPFMVKEEKILLMTDYESSAETAKAVMQLIKACCLNEKFDFDTLSYFDIEFLFLALRARSAGEIQTVLYECNNMVGDDDPKHRCGNKVPVNVDFTKMEVSPNNHSVNIVIDGNIHLEMRYPTAEIIHEFELATTKEEPLTEIEIYETSVKFIASLVNKIISNDGAMKRDVDFTSESMEDWVQTLTHKDFQKLQEFVATMPKVVVKADFACSKCGYSEEMILEGLQSFFD